MSITIQVGSQIFSTAMDAIAYGSHTNWVWLRNMLAHVKHEDMKAYGKRCPVQCIMKYTTGNEVFKPNSEVYMSACLAVSDFIYSDHSNFSVQLHNALHTVFSVKASPELLKYCVSALAGALTDTTICDATNLGLSFHIVHSSIVIGAKKPELWDFFVRRILERSSIQYVQGHPVDIEVVRAYLRNGTIPLYVSTLTALDVNTLDHLADALANDTLATGVKEVMYKYFLECPAEYELYGDVKGTVDIKNELINLAISKKDYTTIMCTIPFPQARKIMGNTLFAKESTMYKWISHDSDEHPITRVARLLSSYMLSRESLVVEVALEMLSKIPTDCLLDGWSTEKAIEYCNELISRF